jgi:4-hydroxy 2-oxovalerate aldolase
MRKNQFQHLDCTLRDGGYYNNWHFKDDLVKSYFKAISNSKIPIIEIGFRFFKSKGFLGPFAYSTENFLNSLLLPKNVKFAVMLNASDILNVSERDLKEKFVKKNKSKISIIRIACNFSEIKKIFKYIKILKKLGYEVYLNLMKISDKSNKEVRSAALIAKKLKVSAFYFADSFGNLQTKRIPNIIKIIRLNYNGLIGIHAHDNSNLAYKNTLMAIKHGIDLVDSTMMGMGRGAGNVATEDILKIYNKKRYIKIKNFLKEYFYELKKNYKWGYSKFYNLGARYNIHPSYIQQLLSDERYKNKDIINIINYLKKNNNSSYNPYTIEKIKISNLRRKNLISSWSAKNWCKNRDVLILGQGNTVSKYSREIECFIKLKKPLTISLNINKNIQQNLVDRIVISNQLRVMLEAKNFNILKNKLIFPKNNYKNIIDEKIIRKIKYGYDFKISEKNWSIKNNYCVIPSSLVAIFSFCVVIIGKPKNIYVVGMDGEGSDINNKSEIISFYRFLSKKFKTNIISLTETNFNFNLKSIYEFI